MRVEQSSTSFLWFIKDKDDKIVKVFHSQDEAVEYLKDKK